MILSFHGILHDAVIVSSTYRGFTIIPNYRPALPENATTHNANLYCNYIFPLGLHPRPFYYYIYRHAFVTIAKISYTVARQKISYAKHFMQIKNCTMQSMACGCASCTTLLEVCTKYNWQSMQVSFKTPLLEVRII